MKVRCALDDVVTVVFFEFDLVPRADFSKFILKGEDFAQIGKRAYMLQDVVLTAREMHSSIANLITANET